MDIDALLNKFDDAIVRRGEAYYRDGHVTELTETVPGEFEARVSGSED